MPCKRNSPGNPCCSPCINCTGTTFEVEAVSFAGTWSTPASDDDSPSCPACPIPGTFIFANSVTKEQLLGTSATPSGEQQCYRSVRQVGSYCQTLIYNVVTYTHVGFGYWKKTRRKIYAREWTEAVATFSTYRWGSGTRVNAGIQLKWIIEFISRKCESTTVNPYGWPGPPPDFYADEASSLAAAKASELDAQCEFGSPDVNYEEPTGVLWSVCQRIEVIRNLNFYDDIAGSESCTPTVCGELTHRSTSSERWVYHNGQYNYCPTDANIFPYFKKNTDGSTPSGGDFTSTQYYFRGIGSGGSYLSGDGNLTGSIIGQEVRILGGYSGLEVLATLKEPCWPTTPTVDVVCNVEEPPPPPDP